MNSDFACVILTLNRLLLGYTLTDACADTVLPPRQACSFFCAFVIGGSCSVVPLTLPTNQQARPAFVALFKHFRSIPGD